jgi:hypothetical protein
MMTNDIQSLAERWREAKAAEAAWSDARREVEDQLSELLAVDPQGEGVLNCDAGAYSIKVTTRLDRKIDADLVTEIAAEHGISDDVLRQLIRWKSELSVSNYKRASPELQQLFAPAVTTKAARPSYTIQPKE